MAMMNKIFGKKTTTKENPILHLELDMRIQVVSDLHLEFYQSADNIPPDIIQRRAPILALLGDVGLACTALLRSFLLQTSHLFEQVLFVAGNHEFYNNNHGSRNKKYTVQEQMEWIQRVCDERENLHFLERRVVEVQGVRILGTTLWSYIPPEVVPVAEHGMNDYQLSYIQGSNGEIQLMRAQFTNAWFQESLRWLKEQIQQAETENRPVVVLTHHTPSLQGTSDPRFEGSSTGHCFSSDLMYLLRDPVKVWACGHTHYNFDIMIGDTRLVSNQRGYPGQEKMTYDSEGIVLRITPPGNFQAS